MLGQIFLKVMDMSRSAGMIIVVVLLVRILLKRFPKFISYLLWSVVLFRLLCPVTLESGFSPVPGLEPMFHGYAPGENALPAGGADAPAGTHTGGTAAGTDVPETDQAVPAQTGPEEYAGVAPAQIPPEGNSRAVKVSWQDLLLLYGKYVWIAGFGIMLLYCVVSTVRLRKRVSVSIPLKGNIYIADAGISPFVMGVFHPRIYLPEGLSGKEQEYIILHEQFHIRRFDHVVKPVAFAALCIHWFNPLVWVAFLLFCRDMEMSCDEAVVKKMGEGIRADYSVSLLALSTKQRIPGGLPVDFGEGDTKGRIRNLAAFRKTKGGVLAALVTGVVILILCLASDRRTAGSDANGSGDGGSLHSGANGSGDGGSLLPDANGSGDESGPHSGEGGSGDGNPPFSGSNASGDAGTPEPPERLDVSLDITEHYQTHVGNPSNLYYIDENNVLWGSGRNQCGQLGLGTQDFEFYDEPVKIAENVIDVDYSQEGFIIFLTEDHRLYGLGNAGVGALQQYSEFDWTRYVNDEHYFVGEPCLLMENVKYARCGKNDVACLTEDGAVWIWGTICLAGNYFSHDVLYIDKPQKVLENAVLVTGGWFNHAALLRDGTVWTWGYNVYGNCGVADLTVVGEPTMVAENVVMVWTDRALENYPQPDAEDIAMAWRGELKYETGYDDISGFDEVYPELLSNTVIRKADGSYWVCGKNVGQEEKMVHSMEGVDYSVICTHEFHPCE